MNLFRLCSIIPTIFLLRSYPTSCLDPTHIARVMCSETGQDVYMQISIYNNSAIKGAQYTFCQCKIITDGIA